MNNTYKGKRYGYSEGEYQQALYRLTKQVFAQVLEDEDDYEDTDALRCRFEDYLASVFTEMKETADELLEGK